MILNVCDTEVRYMLSKEPFVKSTNIAHAHMLFKKKVFYYLLTLSIKRNNSINSCAT